MSRKKAGMSANAKWGIAFLIEIVVMFFMAVSYTCLLYTSDAADE